MKWFPLSVLALACAFIVSSNVPSDAANAVSEVVASTPAPNAVTSANVVTLTQSTYHDEVEGSSVPVMMVIIGDNCPSCADVVKKVKDLAAKYPNIKFAFADVALFAKPPVPPDTFSPSLMTFVPNHPFIYTHDNIDKIAGGLDSLLDARVTALTKLALLYGKANEVDHQIVENRHSFGRLDALRKPSDRAEREHLNQALAELYERKAAIIRQISPIVEDENDAGPAAR